MLRPNIMLFEKLGIAAFLNCKCANTSVKDSLFKASGYPTDNIHADHDYAQYVTTEYVYDTGAKFKKIGLIRNPYERLVSAWADKINKRWKPRFTGYGMTRYMPFDEFVNVLTSKPPVQEIDSHFRPYSMDMFYKGCELPTIYVRFEHLHEDWKKVQAISKIPLPDLPHLTISEHKPWQEYYNMTLYKKVSQYYKLDFWHFHYERVDKCSQ